MIRLRDDVVFHDPEKRIREYCEIEVYWGYDDKHKIDDVITSGDIEAANALYAMIDRYDKTESRGLLRKSKNFMEIIHKIPNIPIHTLNEDEWKICRKDIRELFSKLLAVRGIGLAKATKILHLKRPEVFPVFDNLVVKFLLGVQLGYKNKDVDYGIKALDLTRKIILDNVKEFESLQKSIDDLLIPLTFARLFGILCWSTEKWDIQRKLTAPKGVPSYSLLNIEPIKGKIKRSRVSPTQKARKIVQKKQSGLGTSRSSSFHIVTEFIDELINRAQYGIQGEKPIALVAILKYLNDYELYGINLLELFENPHKDRVKRIFIILADRYSKLASSNNSWAVITGTNKELQYAIQYNGQVNNAIATLTSSELEKMLSNYLHRLTK